MTHSSGVFSFMPALGEWIIHQSFGLIGRDKIRLVFSKTHSTTNGQGRGHGGQAWNPSVLGADAGESHV